jgi:antitoxin CptB
MRELDLLLQSFLSECYPTLSAADQQAFADLLEYPDHDLLSWLMDRESPPNETLARLVQAIKDTRPCRV